jgi:hypothetical protein
MKKHISIAALRYIGIAMQSQSLFKPPARAAASSSATAASAPPYAASGPFSRCQAFASILLKSGIAPSRAFTDVWVCSLAQQIIPEVSRPMLSVLMQPPHAAIPVQVTRPCSAPHRAAAAAVPRPHRLTPRFSTSCPYSQRPTPAT